MTSKNATKEKKEKAQSILPSSGLSAQVVQTMTTKGRQSRLNQAEATPFGAAISTLSGPTCILLNSLPASFGLPAVSWLLK
jgi:hypothetical protein